MKKKSVIFILLLMLILTSCNSNNNDPHVHKYSDWIITQDSTCTKKGIKEKTCSCGAKLTEVIDLKEHTYGENVVVKEATCTSTGVEKKECSVCGKEATSIIPMSEHTLDSEGIITDKGNYYTDGKIEYTCSICNTII